MSGWSAGRTKLSERQAEGWQGGGRSLAELVRMKGRTVRMVYVRIGACWPRAGIPGCEGLEGPDDNYG